MTEATAPAKIAPSAHTMREYETIYLLQQDLTTEQTDRIKERLRGVIEREGGRVIRFTTWGKKKTAFLVGDKQPRAIYVHLAFLSAGNAVAELERNLRNLEEVLKYQTLKVSDAVLPESRPTEEDVVLEGDKDEERPQREEEEGEKRETRAEASSEGTSGEKAEASKEAEAPAKTEESEGSEKQEAAEGQD